MGYEPTLKDIDEAAILEGFKTLKYEKYIKWMNDHVPDTSAEGISFIVETVLAKVELNTILPKKKSVKSSNYFVRVL